jgi:hypothetical protein
MKDGKRVALSFVCMGNICRSPTAEAVMRHLVSEAGLEGAITLDSAGTGEWHVGEERDRRSRAVAKRRGMPITGLARQFVRGKPARIAELNDASSGTFSTTGSLVTARDGHVVPPNREADHRQSGGSTGWRFEPS